MKLKGLELLGFKSFVDKTHFNLERGIICVVGPNGTGKSNIVDSMRWCMGEQRARMLRGEDMDDVVFTGSESRKPSGMAEVSITFTKNGGGLPAAYADYPEIMVTRRFFKTGESEYFINKVPVRWRDVIDLFLDTGIGTKAYSIIDQGMVEKIIMVKPDERRLLFEDAAGIMKYRLRKKEAIANMERTQQNLQRVDDIVREIKRQINSLDRQAKKAERFKAMREELRESEFKFLLLQWRRVHGEVSLQEKELSLLKEIEAAALSEISALSARIEETKISILEAEKKYNELNNKYFNLQSDIQQRDNELNMLRKDIKTSGADRERILLELSGLEQKQKELMERLNYLGIEKAKIETSLGQWKEKVQLLDNEFGLLQNENNRLGKETEESRIVLTDLLSSKSNIKNELLSLQKDVDERAKRIDKLQSNNMELRQNFGTTEASLSTVRERLLTEEKALNLLKASIKGENLNIEGLKNTLDERSSVMVNMNNRLLELKSRYKSQKEIVESYEEFKQGVKALMSRSGADDGKRGIYRVVAEIFNVDPKFEVALEAVLGEVMGHIVVNNTADGFDAIDFLRTASKGRAAFLASENLFDSSVEPPAERFAPEKVVRLTDVVKVENGYEKIARFLLKNVLVVEDAETAKRLWKIDGGSVAIVTLEGDIFCSTGVFSGGSKEELEAGRLRKRRELSLMEDEIREGDAKIETLKNEITALESNISEGETGIKNKESELRDKEILAINIHNEIRSFEDDIEEFKRQLELQLVERDFIVSEIEELKKEYAEKVRGFEDVEGKIREAETCLKKSEEDKRSAEARIAQLNSALTGAKTEFAAHEERLKSTLLFINSGEKDMADILHSLSSRKKETEEKENFIKNAEAELKEKDLALKNVVNDSLLLEKSLNDARAEFEKLSEYNISLDREYTQKRSSLDQTREKIFNLNISTSEKRSGLEYIRSSALDKCQKDFDDFQNAAVEESQEDLEKKVGELQDKINEMGDINLVAADEFRELNERCQFMMSQRDDLVKSLEDLKNAITKINKTSRERFMEAFNAINVKFKEVFPRFFDGGRAELYLTDEHEVLESGIEILAQPPGKRLQNISLLSGGEKALTGIALVFSFFLIKPSPFCILDEADAPLDEANLRRFLAMIKELNKDIQFIMITHNKLSMEVADVLYGITMEEPGVSKVVSVKLN